MIVSLTIVRYRKLFIPFALLAMAIHRRPMRMQKACTFWQLLGTGKNGTFSLATVPLAAPLRISMHAEQTSAVGQASAHTPARERQPSHYHVPHISIQSPVKYPFSNHSTPGIHVPPRPSSTRNQKKAPSYTHNANPRSLLHHLRTQQPLPNPRHPLQPLLRRRAPPRPRPGSRHLGGPALPVRGGCRRHASLRRDLSPEVAGCGTEHGLAGCRR